jgi:hypothetical protein
MDQITIRRNVTSGNPNSEGVWTQTATDTVVAGSFHIDDVTIELPPDQLGRYGQRVKAVVRLPKDSVVRDEDQIVISGFHTSVNGIYEIMSVMYTRTHLRLQLRKTE